MSALQHPVAPDDGRPIRIRRTDRLRGLVIVGLTFVLCLLVSVWARRKSTPVISGPLAPASTVGVVGFPKAIDIVRTLARARQITPRNLLRNIVADNVKSDGSVDITAHSHVRYAFQSAQGEGPQPERAPGTLARRPWCGRQSVVIRKEGIVAETDAAEVACASRPPEPLPEPHCSLADIWTVAIARGVPGDRAARIEYYRANAGPAWRFEAPNPRGHFTLYGDCKRVLEGNDALSVGQ